MPPGGRGGTGFSLLSNRFLSSEETHVIAIKLTVLETDDHSPASPGLQLVVGAWFDAGARFIGCDIGNLPGQISSKAAGTARPIDLQPGLEAVGRSWQQRNCANRVCYYSLCPSTGGNG